MCLTWGSPSSFTEIFWAWKSWKKKPHRAVQRWSSCVFPVQTVNWSCVHFLILEKLKSPEDLVHLAFEVENLDYCIFKLEHSRIPITEGPIETSNGTRFIFTEDPDKYEIELMQHSK